MPAPPARNDAVDPFHLDPHTIRELMQFLDERLAAVKDYGGIPGATPVAATGGAREVRPGRLAD
jgi:hypothetical protein